MKDIKAKIVSNKNIIGVYYKIALEAPYIAKTAKPGQFVQIRCSDTYEPLLRRPFGVHRAKGKNIEILYEVVGKGTEILSERRKGESLSVLGPLGNGFTLPPSANSHHQSAILVAGGIGVAPLLFLADELAREKVEVITLLGAKTKRLILCERYFKRLGSKVHTATDDGTSGRKGLVSALFQDILRTADNGRRTTIYACGPHAMLKCIASCCRDRKLECQVSLEEKMACGFGACLGCVVKVQGARRIAHSAKHKPQERGFSYKLACKDGPIFSADQLLWK